MTHLDSIRGRRSRAARFSSGYDFYDDGYTEQEHEAADLPSTLSTVQGADSSPFYGRKLELQRLRQLRERIVGRHVAAADATAEPSPSVFNTGTAKEEPLPLIDDSSRTVDVRIQSQPAKQLLRPTSLYPAVLISGTSGTGKTRLVRQFLDEVRGTPSNQNSCYILQGKHDEYSGGSDPFSAVSQAFDDFSLQLRDEPHEELERIRRLVRQAFDSNARAGVDNCSADNSSTDSDSNSSSFASAISTLIEVVPSLTILAPHIQPRTVFDSHRQDADSSSLHAMHIAQQTPASVYSPAQQEGTGQRPGKPSAVAANRTDTATAASAGNTQNMWNRMQYIFIQFIKAISTPQKPVYLFLDDLQWSSPAGLQLLATLVSDPLLHSFMLVCVIRQEVDPHNDAVVPIARDAPLRTSFLDLLHSSNDSSDEQRLNVASEDTSCPANADGIYSSTRSNSGNINATNKHLEQITIADLSLSDMTVWMSHMLDREDDDSELLQLARKVYRKTRGNMFFTLKAIEQLKHANILMFSRITFRWEWNLNKQNNATDDEDDDDGIDLPISDNIVAIVESQLKQLPNEIQYVVSVAAYIRSTFDFRTLQTVLDYLEHHRNDYSQNGCTTLPSWSADSQLSSVLDQAVQERLILQSTGTENPSYRFVHDRIQQAAYGLIPYGEIRDKMRLMIGRCLLDEYRSPHPVAQESVSSTGFVYSRDTQRAFSPTSASIPAQINELLFAAVDHLNSVPTKDHVFSATVNLEAGQKALQVGALAQAASYLQRSSNAMKRVRNPWNTHYDTSLLLLRARSEVELSLGHFSLGHKLGNDLIDQARCLDDKLPTYLSMSHALGRQDKFEESLAISLDVARTLGVFPQRFYVAHIIRDISKIRSYLKRYTDEHILNLPLLTDNRMIIGMRFVNEVGLRSYITGNTTQWTVHLCKLIRTSFRHGICEDSAVAFSNLALFASIAFDDFLMAKRCAGLAHSLAEKTRSIVWHSAIHLSTASFIYAFDSPLMRVVRNVQKGHTLGMSAGEFEMGMLNSIVDAALGYVSGYKLSRIIKMLETILQQYRMYRVDSMVHTVQHMLYFFRCMAGRESIDWEDLERQSQRDFKTDPFCPTEMFDLLSRYMNLTTMAAYFRRYEVGYKLVKLFFHTSSHEFQFAQVTHRGWLMGVIASAMYRQTKKRKYIKLVRQQRTALERAVENKKKNLCFYLLLVRAEELASERTSTPTYSRISLVKNAYDAAIREAEASSLTQYIALTNELAGEYLLRTKERLSEMIDGIADAREQQPGKATELLSEETIGGYFTRSITWYQKWECTIKIRDVQERRAEYVRDWPSKRFDRACMASQ